MRFERNKIGLVGDIHLGIHQSSEVWHNISLEFAEWLRDTLIERDIKDLVIPGDILDDRDQVSVQTLHFLPRFFKILEPFNIIITVGNHDCYYNNRSDIHSIDVLDEWENITVIDSPTTISSHGKIISFCPWQTNIDKIPKSDIIFGHFDIQSFKMNGFKICERGVKPNALLEKGSLIITGHFHLTQPRVYKNGCILYLGSPYELSWGEANSPKGIYTLNLKEQKYDFIENTISPKHRAVKLSELLAIGAVTDEVKKEFNGNIIKFIVDIKTEQRIVDQLIAKFKLLKPLELKVAYEYAKIFKTDSFEFEALGVNIQNDLVDFVKGLDFTDQKDKVITYLGDIYKRCEKLLL